MVYRATHLPSGKAMAVKVSLDNVGTYTYDYLHLYKGETSGFPMMLKVILHSDRHHL